VKELWQSQYNDYVAELKKYSEETGGALTSEQLTILERKEKQMQQTQATYVQTASGLYGLAATIVAIIAVALTFIGIYKYTIDKWIGKTKGQVQTATGQGYICALALADDLAARGYTSQAAALVTTMQSRFNNYTMPFMQSEIVRYQNLLPTLVGWELIYANYMIQAYTIEIAAIPTWFTYLPPLPL
jgi:hypothetical protein